MYFFPIAPQRNNNAVRFGITHIYESTKHKHPLSSPDLHKLRQIAADGSDGTTLDLTVKDRAHPNKDKDSYEVTLTIKTPDTPDGRLSPKDILIAQEIYKEPGNSTYQLKPNSFFGKKRYAADVIREQLTPEELKQSFSILA